MASRCESRSIPVQQNAQDALPGIRQCGFGGGIQQHDVTLIIGAWGRVGRCGSSRAISISVRALSGTAYASMFLFVES
jgi:hypothetical protein